MHRAFIAFTNAPPAGGIVEDNGRHHRNPHPRH
jgi:hypothetical protein